MFHVTRPTRVSNRPPITPPHAPDIEAVRVWLEEMIAALSFAKLVVAIVGLITRMRDLNTELAKRVAHLSRKRPRSETLKCLERQLTLPLAGLEAAAPKAAVEPADKIPPEADKPKRSRRGRHPGAR